MWVKQTLGEQRKVLSALLEPPLQEIAKLCIRDWHDMDTLDRVLRTHFPQIPHIQLLYAIDKLGRQLSSNISAHGLDPSYRGQDLSRRPYSVSLYPKRHFMLSSVYISQTTGRPSISAVQPVISDQQFLGFVVADFDIRHLPLAINSPRNTTPWAKEHATPLPPLSNIELTPPTANLSRTRPFNQMDQHLAQISHTVEKLILEHGIFHVTLNYHNNLAMVWEIHDPYQYHLFSTEQLSNDNVLHGYNRSTYPAKASVMASQVQEILRRFQTLRMAKGEAYLCSASLNIINGMVGLSFTSDNSQYIPAPIFLSQDLSLWTGQRSAVNEN